MRTTKDMSKRLRTTLYIVRLPKSKFGQRLNITQSKYVTEPSDFYKLTLDKIKITLINNNAVQISYNKKDHSVEDLNKVNVFVAVFTTAKARLI